VRYHRAVHGGEYAQTEGLCCETCGRAHPVAAAGISLKPKGFDYQGRHVPLSIGETEVFRLLAKGFGEVVHKARVHASIYSADENGGADPKILDIRMCNIRKKIKAAAVPLEIKTVWGVGYQLLALPVGN
jgi:DNA-binding response OmpR family regulator